MDDETRQAFDAMSKRIAQLENQVRRLNAQLDSRNLEPRREFDLKMEAKRISDEVRRKLNSGEYSMRKRKRG